EDRVEVAGAEASTDQPRLELAQRKTGVDEKPCRADAARRLDDGGVAAAAAVLRLALGIEDGDAAAGALTRDLDAVLQRRALVAVLAPEAQHAGEEVRLLAASEFRVDVADEVEALRPVAILDREAAAVKGDADPAPGAVEVVVELQRRSGSIG